MANEKIFSDSTDVKRSKNLNNLRQWSCV